MSETAQPQTFDRRRIGLAALGFAAIFAFSAVASAWMPRLIVDIITAARPPMLRNQLYEDVFEHSSEEQFRFVIWMAALAFSTATSLILLGLALYFLYKHVPRKIANYVLWFLAFFIAIGSLISNKVGSPTITLAKTYACLDHHPSTKMIFCTLTDHDYFTGVISNHLAAMKFYLNAVFQIDAIVILGIMIFLSCYKAEDAESLKRDKARVWSRLFYATAIVLTLITITDIFFVEWATAAASASMRGIVASTGLGLVAYEATAGSLTCALALLLSGALSGQLTGFLEDGTHDGERISYLAKTLTREDVRAILYRATATLSPMLAAFFGSLALKPG